MTVAMLIKRLSAMPQNMTVVWMAGPDDYYDLKDPVLVTPPEEHYSGRTVVALTSGGSYP